MSRACCVDHIVRPNGDSKEVVARWVCGQEEEESVEVEMEDETENGSRTVKKVQDPRDPSKEERAQHEMTHLPYRSWCRHCVRGRGKQMPHQGGSQETSISEVHMDFAFLGREDDPQKTMAVLVAKERTSKMIMSAAAHRKTTGTYNSPLRIRVADVEVLARALVTAVIKLSRSLKENERVQENFRLTPSRHTLLKEISTEEFGDVCQTAQFHVCLRREVEARIETGIPLP